uniref:HTH La-type RNA-binding domain-containing protein n=1 Tax=Parastrongyloides trichosuri TaxID=131310 RepID=A0A0N4YZZ8_PARTI
MSENKEIQIISNAGKNIGKKGGQEKDNESNNNKNRNNYNNKTQNRNKGQTRGTSRGNIKVGDNSRKIGHNNNNNGINYKPPNRGGFPSKPDGLIDKIEFYQTPTINLEIAYFNRDVVRSGIFGPHNPHLKPGHVNIKAIQEYQRRNNTNNNNNKHEVQNFNYNRSFRHLEPVRILPHPGLMFDRYQCPPIPRIPPPLMGKIPSRYGMPKYNDINLLPVKIHGPINNRGGLHTMNNYSKNGNRNRINHNNYDKNKQYQQSLTQQQRKGGNYNYGRRNLSIVNNSRNGIGRRNNNDLNNENIENGKETKMIDDGNEIVKENDDNLLKEEIKKQIEYYFSEDNLIKDLYIRQLMNDSEEKGYVLIEDILNFNKIKNLTKSFSNPYEIIIGVLEDSDKLELSSDKLKIRPGTSVLDQLNNLSFL